MRFSKSASALAIILAVTVLGGSSAYADDSPAIVVARDPSQAQTGTDTSEEPQVLEVTVQPGDTLSAIAKAHGTTIDEIVRQNTIGDPNIIEIGTILKVTQGDGVETSDEYDQLRAAASAFITPPAPVVVPMTSTINGARSYTTAATNSTSYYVGNGMWCTDYVHSMRPDVPIYGNAGYNWISSAQAQGKATGSAPRPGAVAVMNGHVAYVESVNGDGSYVVSEMGWNYKQGQFNRRTVQPGAFGGFIY